MLGYPLVVEHGSDSITIKAEAFPLLASSAQNESQVDQFRVFRELAAIVEQHFKEGSPIPVPQVLSIADKRAYYLVMPTTYTAVVLLWNEMLAQGLDIEYLASVLDRSPKTVRAVFSLETAPPMSLLDEVARVLRRNFHITLE